MLIFSFQIISIGTVSNIRLFHYRYHIILFLMVYIAILGRLKFVFVAMLFPNPHAPYLGINECYIATEFRNVIKLCFQE